MNYSNNLIAIKNTSDFPDVWVRAALEWVSGKVGVQRAGVIVSKGRNSGRARLASNQLRMNIQRKRFRRNWTYSGHSYDKQRIVNTAQESFIFLAAHEFSHISPWGKQLMRDCTMHSSGKRVNKAKLEFQIQEKADWVLAAYRADDFAVARELLRMVVQSERKARSKRVRATTIAEARATLAQTRKDNKNTYQYKLSALEASIAKLEAKQKRIHNRLTLLNKKKNALIKRAIIRGKTTMQICAA